MKIQSRPLLFWCEPVGRLRKLAVTQARWKPLVLVANLLASTTAMANPASIEATQAIVLPSVEKIFVKSGATGMVVAVVRDDALVIRGFGETRAGSARLPEANSLLRVGSISKVLATDLMVRLVSDGKLRLGDPLQAYAPGGYTVPQLSGSSPITLLDVATHTSGLPRSVAGEPPQDAPPFTWPSPATRWRWVGSQLPLSAPGVAALYSNAAYDLLGDALAVAGGKPYDQLLRETVTQPLGMRDTTATPSADQCSRLMSGPAADSSGPCTDTRATASSGGMYSTAADMAVWMRSLLGVTQEQTVAQRAIATAVYVQRQSLTTIAGLDIAGKASGLGLGWVLLGATDHAPAILQKTSGGGGFMGYMALVPGRRIGVFVSVTKMDLALLEVLTEQVNDLVVALDSL